MINWGDSEPISSKILSAFLFPPIPHKATLQNVSSPPFLRKYEPKYKELLFQQPPI